MSKKAVFLDRDKTILIPNGDNYIYRVGDFYIPDNYISALKNLIENNFLLFIITNQGRIAKGYQTEEDVLSVHKFMEEHFKKFGIKFSEFAYCPHNPDGDVYPYNVSCNCRKPKTGLIDDLIEKYDLESYQCWMVGDSKRDIVAGNNAGLSTILVQTGIFSNLEEADFVEIDLEMAVKRILVQINSN